MLSALTSPLLALIVGAAVVPAPGTDTLQHADRSLLLSRSGMVSFAVGGPATMTLQLHGPASLNRRHVPVEVLRHERYSSSNRVRFQKRRGGPPGYTTMARLDVEVPAGKQQYIVKVGVTEDIIIAIATVTGATLRPKHAAAPEMETSAAAVAEVPAELIPDTSTLQALAGNPPARPSTGGRPGLAKAIRVAVYDFKVEAVDQSIANIVTDSVLAEVRKLKGVAAIGMEEIRDMLSHEANKQILGCQSDESCLAEIAGALGVDFLITGTLSKAADSHIIDVKRIDQTHAKVTGAVNRRLKADTGQEFLLAIGPTIEQLFPDRELKPGRERGVADEVALRLNPPPLPPWSFWGVVGAGGVALTAGGVFGILANENKARFDKLSRDSTSGVVVVGADYTRTITDTRNRARGANILFSTGAALAISAAVMYLFTDFDGYGDDVQAAQR